MSHEDSGYIIDTTSEKNSTSDLARLIYYEKISKYIDLVPDGFSVKRGTKILDLACGPAEWLRTIAEHYPQASSIVGIDSDQRMITWGKTQTARFKNVVLCVGNIHHPLPFSDDTFDLINARFLLPVMTLPQWRPLFAECFRVSKPGGILLMTEACGAEDNTPQSVHLAKLMHIAFYRAQKAFDDNLYSIVLKLKSYIEECGYDIDGEKQYTLDQSYGTALHPTFTQHLLAFFELVKPFLRTYLTEEEAQGLDTLLEDVAQAALKEGYQALYTLMSVVGRKPKKRKG